MVNAFASQSIGEIMNDMTLKEYIVIFESLQKFVDEHDVNPTLAKKIVETLNQEAHNHSVPIKFDPDILDVTKTTYPYLMAEDEESKMLPEEPSVWYDEGSSFM